MSKKIVTATLSAILALGIASDALAEQKPPANMKLLVLPKGMEKCYGIAKAGKNDCGTTVAACAGLARYDSDKKAWIALPIGTCDKIVGGSTTKG